MEAATLGFFKVVGTTLGARTRTLLANLRGVGATGADDDAEPIDGAEVLQPLGLFARPVLTAHLEALAARLGDEVVAFCLGDKGGARFDDCEPGETRLYSSRTPAGCIRLRADGSIELASSGGARLVLTASGDVQILPGVAGSVYLATTAPSPGSKPVAAGSDAVASGVITPTSRKVLVPAT